MAKNQDKKTNNDQENTTQKLNDRAPLKPGGELRYPEG